MQIDRSLILKLENLSRLELDEAERAEAEKSLNNILSMIEKLEELDTEGVEPLVYISEEDFEPRADVAGNQLTAEQALLNAPDKQDGKFFKVPKVINL
jgi:aspartyl-tRNA(Asn)/glutamyl-tRNA(Gln) amidotransferase subunit C